MEDDDAAAADPSVTTPRDPAAPTALTEPTTPEGAEQPEPAPRAGPSPVPDACKAAKVVTGANHHCAVTRGGQLYCWGANYYHQLGYEGGPEECPARGNETKPCNPNPERVPEVDNVVQVALGTMHTCAVEADGSVWCWGSNQGADLGTSIEGECFNPWAQSAEQEFIPCTATPTRVEGVTHAIDIDAWGTTCVAEQDGNVKCWGNVYGRTPTFVPGIEAAVSVEDGCALDEHGTAYCWERTAAGAPVEFEGVATDLTKGYNQVCLVDEEQQLHCWGLGLTWSQGVFNCVGCSPTLVEGVGDIVQVSGGLEVTWVLNADGQVGSLLAWADSFQLTTLPEPAVDVSAGYYGACAVLEGGAVYCWGNEAPSSGIPPSYEPRQVELCTPDSAE